MKVSEIIKVLSLWQRYQNSYLSLLFHVLIFIIYHGHYLVL